MPAAPAVFRYRLAGLQIESDFALLEGTPTPGGNGSDPLIIASGTRLGLPEPHGSNARSADARRARLAVPDVGRFLIEDGRRVTAWPCATTSAETLSQQLAGPVLALALMQRGVLVLHGSVVAIGGRAVVILGHSGDGKSTTAAACAARGHTVLSDDLAPLDISGDEITVRTTCALVRMGRPFTPGGLDDVRWQAADKTAIRVGELPPDERLPVGAAVVLAESAVVEVIPLPGARGVLALLDHAFCRTAFQREQAADALAQCAEVPARCQVVTLARPKRLDALPAVVAAIESLMRVGR